MTAPALPRSGGVDPSSWIWAAPVAASLAAAGLAITSTGTSVVAAVLVGVGVLDRWAGLATVLAAAAVGVRFATIGLGDLAGIQSVLGPAGVVGPPVAAASTWCAAAAVLLATVPPGTAASPDRKWSVAPALASGSLAAALVAGPGPGGGLGIRIGATVVGVVLAAALASTGERLRSRRVLVAVAIGMVAVGLAGWPS